MSNYQFENNRDVAVLFLTDGYPNEDIPNQISTYEVLKIKYPYMTINGIQYEMGNRIVEDIKRISDNEVLPPNFAQLSIWDAQRILNNLEQIKWRIDINEHSKG